MGVGFSTAGAAIYVFAVCCTRRNWLFNRRRILCYRCCHRFYYHWSILGERCLHRCSASSFGNGFGEECGSLRGWYCYTHLVCCRRSSWLFYRWIIPCHWRIIGGRCLHRCWASSFGSGFGECGPPRRWHHFTGSACCRLDTCLINLWRVLCQRCFLKRSCH